MMARTAHICLTLATLAALVAVGNAGRQAEQPSVQDFKPPKWYHDKDGPIFDVLQTEGDVDLRRVWASKWVQVNITGKSYDQAWNDGTKLLDDYWNGNNAPKTKLADTVPIVVMIYPTGAGQAIQAAFTYEYFLPHENLDQPPLPSTPGLAVIDTPVYDVWVKTFGGYVGEKELIDQAFGFADNLRSRGVDPDLTTIALALYDNPLQVVGRHNEIWIWAKPAPSLGAIAAARNQVQRAMESAQRAISQPLVALQAAFNRLAGRNTP